MTLAEVRKAVHTAPFQPFTMYLADGPSLMVPHPDFMALSGEGRTVVLYAENEHAHSIVDLLLVTRLEAKEPFENASSASCQ